MLTDEELEALPDDPYAAFVVYERICRRQLNDAAREDGGYYWELARQYVAYVDGFIEQLDLDIKTEHVVWNTHHFEDQFHRYLDQIDRHVAKYRLRNASISLRKYDTVLYLNDDYRAEIYGYIEKIRKIIANVDLPENLRESIWPN